MIQAHGALDSQTVATACPSSIPGRRPGSREAMTTRIAVIMTCHNRRETTVRCLRHFGRSRAGRLRLFVTDDGSTDGTSEAIRAIWPEATIIHGTGTLFWAAGMALAERAAVSVGRTTCSG